MARKDTRMNIEKLLSRLQGVKKTGSDRWICKCPSHQDKSPSLTISIDSRTSNVLVTCFAGCDTYSILKSIGCDWEDVFPEKAHSHHVPKVKSVIYATEGLELLRYEAQIVTAYAMASVNEEVLLVEDYVRLRESMQRINKVYQAVNNGQ